MLTTRSTASLAGLALLAVLCLLPLRPIRAEGGKPFDHQGLAQRALERHIRPGYDRFATTAADFSAAVTAFCEARKPAGRRRLDDAFGALVRAWGRIEHIRFGPITEDRRLERVLLWPDRRGLGQRQVERAIRKRDQSVLDSNQLAAKSVALQGLLAAELVLYGGDRAQLTSRSEEGAFRCSYARAIAANLAQIGSELRAAWQKPEGFSHLWLTPGPDNPLFLEPRETTMALAKAFGEGLERVRDERIGGPIGFNPQRVRTPAVLTRSRRTMTLITANVVGLQNLFNEGGIGDAILATGMTHPSIGIAANVDLVRRELATARKEVSSVGRGPEIFQADSSVQRLIASGFPLKNAAFQTAALLSVTAGLTLGFNASDGD